MTASSTSGSTDLRSIRVEQLRPGASLEEFIELQWRINAADPHWVPPLRMAVRTALDRRKHPFHQHAEVAYFIARRDGPAVGRIAAIINRLHNDFHEDQVGFFGLFEAVDDVGVARALVDAAADWLRERGMVSMRGPVNFSTNEEISSPGVLVEGFARPPMAMMSHNPAYYDALLAATGLHKEKDLLAFWLDDPNPPQRLIRGMARVVERMDATIRPLDLKHFRREVDIVKAIYNSAWSRNWGFVPMTDAEFDHMANQLRPVVDPALCLIAEVKGEPVGFSLAIPNLNHALRHLPSGRLFPFGLFRFLWHKRSIRGLRVLTLGFKPGFQQSGLGAALYLQSWMAGTARGYDHGEASWILEDNLDMIRPLERMGAEPYRRYRIYQRPL